MLSSSCAYAITAHRRCCSGERTGEAMDVGEKMFLY
jgi:hypothetical protein